MNLRVKRDAILDQSLKVEIILCLLELQMRILLGVHSRCIHVVSALSRPLRERFRNETRNGARVSYGNLFSFMVGFAWYNIFVLHDRDAAPESRTFVPCTL